MKPRNLINRIMRIARNAGIGEDGLAKTIKNSTDREIYDLIKFEGGRGSRRETRALQGLPDKLNYRGTERE